MLNVLVALLPVLSFLAALVLLDSFKLVRPRAVARALAAGAAAAVAAALLHEVLLDRLGLEPRALARYVAPATEELLKAVYVAHLIRRRRVGFLVDAAIAGFAVGAGFALVENVDYLRGLRDGGLLLWIARGFGTAMLHGATSGILAIVAKRLADRRGRAAPGAFVPGLLAAIGIHAAYNHFLLPPLLATGLLMTTLPLAVVAVFGRSEASMREWLGVGLDTELELLESILSGQVAETRVGAYLLSLQARFPGTVVADMLCLLRVQLELSIRAKGLLLAREAGFALAPTPEVRASLEELRYLEREIGTTGLLALKPVLRRSSRDLWQIYMLEEQAAGAPAAR